MCRISDNTVNGCNQRRGTYQVNYNWTTGYDEPSPNWFDWVVHIYQGADVTFMGNVAIQGPDSIGEIYLDDHHDDDFPACVEDNIIIDPNGNPLTVYDPDDVELLSSPPPWNDGIEVIPAHESLYEGLRTVGPRPGDRDPHNARLARSMADGTGDVIDTQRELAGLSGYDSIGYPNYASTQRSLTVPDGASARQEWLDGPEDEIAVDTDIDLSLLYNMAGSQASDRYAP